jgi:hypothetical protein
MPLTATSKNGIVIRLTDERWQHIVEEHAEVAPFKSEIMKAVAEPTRVFGGAAGESLGVRELELGKFIVVVYRELEEDGFVITAFLTRRMRSLERRRQIWP